MLVRDTVAGNAAVVEFFFPAEFVIFAGFYWMFGVSVNLFDPDVTRINFRPNPRRKSDAGCLEQREIMGFSVGKSRADNLP